MLELGDVLLGLRHVAQMHAACGGVVAGEVACGGASVCLHNLGEARSALVAVEGEGVVGILLLETVLCTVEHLLSLLHAGLDDKFSVSEDGYRQHKDRDECHDDGFAVVLEETLGVVLRILESLLLR